MARFKCKCGAELSNSEAPNDVEFWVYSDREWDECMVGDCVDPVTIAFPKFEVWRCYFCQRVHIFDGNTRIKTYIAERDY
ncbi:MAG: hypothetical protein C4331_07735 [Meiothermus sp.]